METILSQTLEAHNPDEVNKMPEGIIKDDKTKHKDTIINDLSGRITRLERQKSELASKVLTLANCLQRLEKRLDRLEQKVNLGE